ncbi:hypothetical protein [Maribacter sp. ACAM166]|uniref:hypothetical protein n=1 Tax=Maribacter sp. ACAM166 TaxID=2508996 RepID=UPI0010FF323E|nr:hypothetical protein [Maribacter sp. ACAM166]TLP81739.1 hypothetical protein ES765_03370 [Maribacter sp. ACAM166]
MEIAIYAKAYRPDSIDNFIDFYNSLHMRYLASDLLNEGLTPKQISDAVVRAINVAKSSRMSIREHFKPVFSSINNEIISDCKLSRLGYCLVLMNAETKLSAVGDFQIDVLKKYLDTTS